MEAIDAALQAAHEREKYAKGSATRILNFLRDLEEDTAAKLAARIERMSERDKANFVQGRSRGQYSTERLQRLLLSIQEMSVQWRRITEENIGISAKELVAAELQLQSNVLALQGVLGEGITAQAVVSAVYSQPLMAKPLREYFKDQEASVRKTVTDSIRRSFVAGETVEQTVKSLMGTKALKYTDGDLRKHRNGVRMLARTALNHVSNVTAIDSFKALGVEKYVLVATLDGRTSSICRSLDGRKYSVDNASAPRPPFHGNCRTFMMADLPGLEDETRASNGPTGAKQIKYQTYKEWFAKQPASFQRDQLTALQYKLYKNGGLSLDKFADLKSFKELTDIELRAKYSAIIGRIGDTAKAA